MGQAAKTEETEVAGSGRPDANPPTDVDAHGARHENMSSVGLLSRHAAARCLSDVQPALEAIRAGQRPELYFVVWPAGLDRSVLKNLSLGVRTRNCLLAEQLMEGDSPLTVQEFLRVPNFGLKSLTDLLLTTEHFLKQCAHGEDTDLSQARQASPNGLSADASPTSWARAAALLGELLATAAELHEAETLADGLNERTRRLAVMMGIADEIEAIKIDEMTEGASGLVSAGWSDLERMIDAATDTERRIIEQRLLRTPPRTLEDVGSEAGVTRERIRQIQVRVEKKIRSALRAGLPVIAPMLKEEFGHLISRSELETRIDHTPGEATRSWRRSSLSER